MDIAKKRMNALLVYPECPNTFWSFKYVLKFIRKKAAYPPLGLLTVSSMLPRGWKRRLVDCNVRKLTDADLEWADIVLLSAMLVQSKSAQEIINRARAKGRRIVAGGPAFTTQHERFEGIDHFVLNEAEVTLPLFLKDLEKGSPGRIYTSGERPDITRTPVPDWSLLRLKDYVTMPLQYSRGCPFNCEFCDIVIMNGRVPRTKTPAQVIRELQALYDAGWRDSVFIVDDNFIGNKKEVKVLLPAITAWQKKNKYPFKLLTEASINLADDDELMRLMSLANFHKVFLGIETPNNDSLQECGKMQNVNKDLAEAVKTIHQHGMQVMGGFVLGFDSDTERVFERQFRFIQKIGVATAMVGMLTALPQTRLWHRLKEEGRLTGDSCGENTSDCVNFIPRMGKEKLLKGYNKLVRSIYSPKHYYRRVYTFVKQYRPTVKARLSRRDVISFLKSMLRIGIFSRASPHYWKLIIKTCLRNRKALPIAVELSIIWLHFDKVARRLPA